jgi:hypothetical protein
LTYFAFSALLVPFFFLRLFPIFSSPFKHILSQSIISLYFGPLPAALTTRVKVVFGKLGGPVDKVAQVGQQFRVGFQHEVFPLEVGVLALWPRIHQVKPVQQKSTIFTHRKNIRNDNYRKCKTRASNYFPAGSNVDFRSD